MNPQLTTLLHLLRLQRIDENCYQGHNQDLGLYQVFGGQLIAQALYAARQSLPAGREIHSFHCYFLRPASSDDPVTFCVDHLRDGHSFSTRQVRAEQQALLMEMTASFQRKEKGFEHQSVMPDVPPPETLLPEQELEGSPVPAEVKNRFLQQVPIELRPVIREQAENKDNPSLVHYVWMRFTGQLPSQLSLHQELLGYASDLHFLPTALQPHGKYFLESDMQVATLNHAMWFHRPFRVDEWFLYAIDSPSASGARGFVRGQFYSRSGALFASSVQEGVIRQRLPR